MIWTFRIPVVTPSGNVTIREHRWARSERKDLLGWLVASALIRATRIPPATGKRRLTIERHGKRALDQDNLAAGAKALIDVIKNRRLILDDRPQDCELVFRQVPCGKESPYTVCILEDI